MTSIFTGVGVWFMDIDPLTTEALACDSSVGLRPSQPMDALPVYPASRLWDLRDVSLPESLRLFASGTPQPSSGRWQVTHAVLPEAESAFSKKRSRPRSTSA